MPLRSGSTQARPSLPGAHPRPRSVNARPQVLQRRAPSLRSRNVSTRQGHGLQAVDPGDASAETPSTRSFQGLPAAACALPVMTPLAAVRDRVGRAGRRAGKATLRPLVAVQGPAACARSRRRLRAVSVTTATRSSSSSRPPGTPPAGSGTRGIHTGRERSPSMVMSCGAGAVLVAVVARMPQFALLVAASLPRRYQQLLPRPPVLDLAVERMGEESGAGRRDPVDRALITRSLTAFTC